MMSNLEKFIIRRAAVILLLAALVLMFLPGGVKWPVLAGIIAGAFVGALRLRCNELILRKMLGGTSRKALSWVLYTLNQLVLLPVIAGTYFLDSRALFGLVAGLLTIPAAVMINSVTEALGITKNNFELGGD